MADDAVYEKGALVFIPDPVHGYVSGVVDSLKIGAGVGGSIILEERVPTKAERLAGSATPSAPTKTTPKVIEVTAEQVKHLLPMDYESHNNMSDLIGLKRLNDGSILHNLRMRFGEDEIYTNVGSILVSLNPFKILPIYTPEIMERYEQLGALRNPPHVFALADNAYRRLTSANIPQSCIVSGESGAGKTEATKLFLSYITAVSSRGDEAGHVGSIQEQILEANPLLEAFGNAKTTRNNNSSRFGKWITIVFNNKRGNIIGGNITQYLLEKIRVVKISPKERNYHILYQVCAAASADPIMADKFDLDHGEKYWYLNQHNEWSDEKQEDDLREWRKTYAAMKVIGIAEQECEEVIDIIAGICNLGNVRFHAKGGVDPGVEPSDNADEDALADNTEGEASVVSNFPQLVRAAGGLLVDPRSLEKALITRAVSAGRETVYADNSAKRARATRDSLAKSIYTKLFSWLVSRVNSSLASMAAAQGRNVAEKDQSFIGVLDIFGFEQFERNSFEQLCINFCNEKLQGHFNEHIFKLEQDMYEKEGLDVSKIEFSSNDYIIEAFESKGDGVFARLEEELITPKGSDAGFLSKLTGAPVGGGAAPKKKEPEKRASIAAKDGAPAIAEKKKAVFAPEAKDTRHNKQLAMCFIVNHFAGQVAYNVTGFLTKNRDDLVPALQQLCEKSDLETLRSIFDDVTSGSTTVAESGRATQARGGSSKRSVATQFRASLSALVQTLNQTEPHFVRCVKSNSLNKPDTFDSVMVLRQLRYSGLMEVSRIRQMGYPVRRSFKEFFERYRLLAPHCQDLDTLLATIGGPGGIFKEWQKGKSLVFMRDQSSREIEAAREAQLAKLILKMQRNARRAIQMSRYRGYKVILNNLRAAMVSNDITTLERAILTTGNLPHSGVHLSIVKEARVKLDALQEQARILALLAEAVNSRDPTAIESAIQAANEVGLRAHAAVVKAGTVIKSIREERAARDALRAAVLSRDEAQLDAALATAKALGMEPTPEAGVSGMRAGGMAMMTPKGAGGQMGTFRNLNLVAESARRTSFFGVAPTQNEQPKTGWVEVRAALTLKERLKEERMALESLRKAMETKRGIEDALSACADLGMRSNPLVLEAEKVVQTIAKVSQERAAEVARITRRLNEARDKMDLEELEQLHGEVIRLGLTGPSVDSAMAVRLQLLGQNEAYEGIIAESRTLAVKAKSHNGITREDLTPLTKAIIAVKKSGFGNHPTVERAIHFQSRMVKQLVVQEELKQALRDKSLLKQACDKALELGMESRLAKLVYAEMRAMQQRMDEDLKKQQAELTSKPLLIQATEKERLKDQTSRLSRPATKVHAERVEKAKNDVYKLELYVQIRSDEDYTKLDVVPEIKQQHAEYKLKWQRDIITRSVLSLSDPLNLLAVRNHRSIMGWCGDVHAGFPASLALDVLVRGLETPDLVDEIYMQACKQLTDNPKEESQEKTWLLMCMLTKTFPPSERFSLYLLNYLVNATSVKGLAGNFARLCLVQLDSTFEMGASWFSPSLEDIVAYTKRPPILATIGFVDGTSREYAVTPDVTVELLTKAIARTAKHVRPAEASSYGLFVVPSPNVEDHFVVSRSTRVPHPALTPYPMNKSAFFGDVYVKLLRQNPKNGVNIVFKRRLFVADVAVINTPDEQIAVYLELVYSVVSGALPVPNEVTATSLCALGLWIKTLQLNKPPSDESTAIVNGMMEFMPGPYYATKTEQDWAQAVVHVGKNIKDTNPFDLMTRYINTCSTFPLYGMCLFQAYRDGPHFEVDLLLGIGAKGVALIGMNQVAVLIPYLAFRNYGGTSTNYWIDATRELIKRPSNTQHNEGPFQPAGLLGSEGELFKFYSNEAMEINVLTADYLKKMHRDFMPVGVPVALKTQAEKDEEERRRIKKEKKKKKKLKEAKKAKKAAKEARDGKPPRGPSVSSAAVGEDLGRVEEGEEEDDDDDEDDDNEEGGEGEGDGKRKTKAKRKTSILGSIVRRLSGSRIGSSEGS